MLWHIVKYRFAGDVDDGEREAWMQDVRRLPAVIGSLRFLRLAPSIDDVDVVGLIIGFENEAALATYREHPAHVPVADRARQLCTEIVWLDITTADPSNVLSPVG